MTKNNANVEPAQVNECYLPDFCNSEINLRLFLVLELMAIVLALASSAESTSLFIHLALISMYIQWIGLSSAALLCLAKRWNLLNSHLLTTFISLLVVVVVTTIMAVLAFQIDAVMQLDMFNQFPLFSTVLYHLAISCILYGLALRYFFVQHASHQGIKAESQARLQALQARIRPHFLFNSLNTIASLTHYEPDKAERAIEDLAELFRASLKADAQISLQSEIELTKDYINLEFLRLDDRLRVSWNIENEMDDLLMPALILQPLVENAIYHGVEPLQEGGEVQISIKTDQNLSIEITNPLNKSGATQRRQGNQMALDNIRERLLLAFQGQAKLKHLVENDLYKVVISIPITKLKS